MAFLLNINGDFRESALTPIIFNMELTHLGSEASKYVYMSIFIV